MSETNTKTRFGPLGEVHISVSDLETMRRFYLDIVGFEEEFYDKGEMLGLKTGGGSSLAFVVSNTNAKGVALALDCADVDAAVVELEGLGIEITERPWDGHWGGRVAAFADPEGNTVYLEQPPSE